MRTTLLKISDGNYPADGGTDLVLADTGLWHRGFWADALASRKVTIRPALPSDQDFIRQLYIDVHAQELTCAGISDELLPALIRQQACAQEQSYRQQFSRAVQRIMEHQGVPMGRLLMQSEGEAIRLIDIAIAPAWQRRGIGRAVVGLLLEQSAGRAVQLHVMSHSPARRLYERFGFRVISVRTPYLMMEYPASHSAD